MKRLIYSILAIAAFVVSCEKDGEKLIVTPPGAPSDFGVSATEIVLSSDGADDLVLSLFWNAGALPEVSDPTVALPDGLTEHMMQFSGTEDFSDCTEVALKPDQTSLQFTGGELSKLLIKLGMTEAQQYDVYARLAVKMGSSYTYGNVVALKVTAFAVETGWMKVVDKADNTKVVATLYSRDGNPEVFEGFAVVASWYNFFFLAADGIIWGCDADWTKYSVVYNSSNNLWFAAPAGCQWVVVDTASECWSQVSIAAVDAVVDGVATTLKFTQSSGEFKGTITTAADNTSVTVSGIGTLYDKTTGDSAGVDNPFSFALSADGTFDYVNAAVTSAPLVVETAGTYTLTLNVNDRTWTLESGAEAPPTVSYPDNVSMYYYVKEGSVQLAQACKMAETDTEGVFEGFIWTDPAWAPDFSNYRFHADDKVYSSNDGGQYVLAENGWNCWSGDAGMNYVVADFTTMTWSETKVTKIAVTGDFNSWSLDTDPLIFNMSTGRWEAECDINTIEYGFKFVLDDASNSWRWMYADVDLDGVLNICGSNDNIVPAATGRYKIELDLSNFASPTYTMTKLD